MATAQASVRRRAAWAVLTPVIDEDAVIESLWVQHDSMRGESVSDIIAFIDTVAARHLLDAATRKRLYAAYFEALRWPEEQLPIDPWPLMLLTRPAAASPPSAPLYAPPAWSAGRTAAPMAAPVAPATPVSGVPMSAALAPAAAMAAARSASPPAPSSPATGAGWTAPAPSAPAPLETVPSSPSSAAAPSAISAHQAVFATLMGSVMAGVRQFHPDALADLLADGRARFERLRVPAALRQGARKALSAEDASTWVLEGSVEQLSSLVHELYVALCEALGPVDADQILMQAVRQAEQRPEARQVPPSRFL